MTKAVEVVPGVSITAYREWLKSPVTRALYSHFEANSRPQMLDVNCTEESAAYRLGFVTGLWAGLDMPRNVLEGYVPEGSLEADYEGGE